MKLSKPLILQGKFFFLEMTVACICSKISKTINVIPSGFHLNHHHFFNFKYENLKYYHKLVKRNSFCLIMKVPIFEYLKNVCLSRRSVPYIYVTKEQTK